MRFPERATAEVSVRDIEKDGFLGADPGMMQSAEQGVVAAAGAYLRAVPIRIFRKPKNSVTRFGACAGESLLTWRAEL